MANITYESKIATGKAIRIAAEQIKKLLMGENGTTILSKWIPGTMDDVLPFNGISTTALEGTANILGGTSVNEIKYDSVNKWFVALDVEGNPYANWESDEDTHGEYNFSSGDAYGTDSTNGRTPYSNKIYFNLEDDKWYRWIGDELRVIGGKDVDLSGIQHIIENLQDEVDAVESQAITNMQNISKLNTSTSSIDSRLTVVEKGLSFKISANKSLIEAGVPTDVKFTATISSSTDSNLVAEEIKIKDPDYTVIQTGTKVKSITVTKSLTIGDKPDTKPTYTATCKYLGYTPSASVSIDARYYTRFGWIIKSTADGLDSNAIVKKIVDETRSKSNSLLTTTLVNNSINISNNTKANAYFYILVPSNVTNLASAKDSGGFAFEFINLTTEGLITYNGVAYIIMRSNNAAGLIPNYSTTLTFK